MATNSRERAKRDKETRDKRPTAIAKYIRIAPTKVAIVLDLVRGKSYSEAVAILTHTNKSASPVILKVLHSAAANAENNMNMPKESLFVAECYSLQGPTMKRMMPRAKGRGDRILKRTSHIRIILDEKMENVTLPKKKVADKKAAKVSSPKTDAKNQVAKPVAGAKKDAVATDAKKTGAKVDAPKKDPVKKGAGANVAGTGTKKETQETGAGTSPVKEA